MTAQVSHKFFDVDQKEYFMHIGAIAAFISARLQHQSPRCNADMPVSTIHIDQHKEKFGSVRIYCTLAEDGLVKQMWKAQHPEIPRPVMPAAFKDECWLRDARYYRRCYLDMVSLVPQYKDSIVDSADHRELLYETIDDLNECLEDDNVRKFLFGVYDVSAPWALVEKLRSVYV